MTWTVGDRVRVLDGSEAHGDKGIVDAVFPDGVVFVALTDFGCIWVCQAQELTREEDHDRTV